MPSTSHIAFARNSAGQLVSATDLLDNVPQTYSCVACGHALEVRRPAKSPAYFRHVTDACELGNQHATRAAALSILAEGRFVFAPALLGPSGRSGPRKGKDSHRVLEQWGDDVALDTIIDGVAVDFFAHTLGGPLVIQVCIPDIYNVRRHVAVKALGLPTLEIVVPRKERIHRISDLRRVVQQGLSNKVWLRHPVLEQGIRVKDSAPSHQVPGAALANEGADAPTRLTVPLAVPSWINAGSHAENALYRQKPIPGKIEVLEGLLGLSCDRWPDAVDIEVQSQSCCGVDRRIWQADVFARFVAGAGREDRDASFAVQTAQRWLAARYNAIGSAEQAQMGATFHYLRELTLRGYLLELNGRQFRPTGRWRADAEPRLHWVQGRTLNVSELRACSTRVRFEVPAEEVQRLLEYFSGGHPAVGVESFVREFSRVTCSPERSVVALLREARLVEEESVHIQREQGDLF
ncbi:MAG: hypothetical protein QOC89_2063 [Paraburkholderia sp.]|uniref:hypothetical protein n=1 Tax=Paraburkholderia sp. TaxID=1926495 RepID=UPI002AFEEA3B|nr:hypothetical protein [Paraburkholderia sp.]MEA3084366.1 hypothetical protein [Paraburkholderia sp.]MEA3131996.1 hypothetical protein [Paraburkholderia sp.]